MTKTILLLCLVWSTMRAACKEAAKQRNGSALSSATCLIPTSGPATRSSKCATQLNTIFLTTRKCIQLASSSVAFSRCKVLRTLKRSAKSTTAKLSARIRLCQSMCILFPPVSVPQTSLNLRTSNYLKAWAKLVRTIMGCRAVTRLVLPAKLSKVIRQFQEEI